MTDRYDSYVDDWLPEDLEDTEGSYDFDYDALPKEPELVDEITIDDYLDDRVDPTDDGFDWLYWR